MNVDISCTARHRNSVCGQGLQHIPKEIKFKIDCVTLKNWPRIWMISFKRNIAAFPTENQPGFSKAKARSANGVYGLLFPVPESCESKIVLLLLFDRRNATMSKLWVKGLRESFQKGNVPCAKSQHNSNPQLFLTSTRQERCSHRNDFLLKLICSYC